MRLISRENALCSAQSEPWVSHAKASEQAGGGGALELFLRAFRNVPRGANPFGKRLMPALQHAPKHENCPQHRA